MPPFPVEPERVNVYEVLQQPVITDYFFNGTQFYFGVFCFIFLLLPAGQDITRHVIAGLHMDLMPGCGEGWGLVAGAAARTKASLCR